MALEFGVLFALGALVFWGFGDFLIQRSTRRLGDWETLLAIGILGSVVLMPFVYSDITALVASLDTGLLVLSTGVIIIFIASMLDFEALKKGKISVVEPLLTLEIPISALLAAGLLSETIGLPEVLLILTLVAGLLLVSLKRHHFSRRIWIEKGAFLGLAGALFMGMSNFIVGFASRITNPLVAIWFIWMLCTVLSLLYLSASKKMRRVGADFMKSKKLLLITGALDTAAWVSFAFAATLMPIAIAVALSESYIALAALLGLLISKEKLLAHQKAGLVVALGSAIVLAAIV
ncbi:MAG: DMT family transporter [Candidatus Aenigmarchaeota archaeon]|nr:DMT family transporter [Candidatus Aenigmarchaeota archaeon]